MGLPSGRAGGGGVGLCPHFANGQLRSRVRTFRRCGSRGEARTRTSFTAGPACRPQVVPGPEGELQVVKV